MSKKFQDAGVKKTQNSVGRPRKVVAPPPMSDGTITALRSAINEARAPTITELLQECKVLIGGALVSLRGAEDAYRASTAISNLVRAIATVSTAERVEEISDDVLKTMSVDELKAYTTKMLDKLN